MKKRVFMIISIILLILIITLWVTGIIPKNMGKYVAINYVNKSENGKEYKFEKIEYSQKYKKYVATFVKNDNVIIALMLNSKYFPTYVEYDSTTNNRVTHLIDENQNLVY